MNIALYTLTSSLHDKSAVDAVSQEFLSSIESVLGGLGDEASALWRVVRANPRMAALVAAALAAGGYGIHALMSEK